MFRRAFLLLVLPMAGLTAQSGSISITVTASNDAVFRIVAQRSDTSRRLVLGRGHMEFHLVSGAAGTLAVVAEDSSTRIHVEATEDNRVVASGDGAFITIRTDSDFVSVEARNRIPPSLRFAAERKPGDGDFASTVTVTADRFQGSKRLTR